MTPKPPTPMTTLRDNGDIKLDPEQVFRDPRAEAIEWLRQYAEEKRKEEANDTKAVP